MGKVDKRQRKIEANKLFMQEMLKRPAGVFCIRNKQNGKVFISSSIDINNKLNRLKHSLETNDIFPNKALQNDYNALGKENFAFEILEEVKMDEVSLINDDTKLLAFQDDMEKKVKELEKKWFEKLQPYGEYGYHRKRAEKKQRLKAKVESVEDKQINSYFSLKDLSELFWNASIYDLKQGYIKKKGQYICLVCGKCFDEDVIYPKGDLLYNAKKAVKEHIIDAHGSMVEVFLNMDKKYMGLSDIQSELVMDFYKGLDDGAIAKKAGISNSTVRNHRFRLKEKQKQAKIFLALMSLVDEKQNEEDKMIAIHKSPRMLDERYAISKEREKEVVQKFIKEDGTLFKFPKKEKDKIIILFYFASQFEYNVTYNESEVNEIIKPIYEDYVTVRRYLIEYGFMNRSRDCLLYWLV